MKDEEDEGRKTKDERSRRNLTVRPCLSATPRAAGRVSSDHLPLNLYLYDSIRLN